MMADLSKKNWSYFGAQKLQKILLVHKNKSMYRRGSMRKDKNPGKVEVKYMDGPTLPFKYTNV